jgi:hypothetical protein
MVKWQLRRKAVANMAAATNDAGNGSTSSVGTEENWLKTRRRRSERALFIKAIVFLLKPRNTIY